jgi:helicase
MKIEQLKLPNSAIKFLKSQGFEKLYPPQADSVNSGLLDGKSLLVSSPTASGKTLIAMLAILSYLSKHDGKVIYLSPLRALAAEKFLEFKKLEKIVLGKKIKVGISTGDFENIEKNLEKSNILILTNEKMDSIIRHGTEWIEEIGLVITDEVHLIGDETRGPTLEMTLTQLKLLETKPQIVGLSATITNSDEIANWLGCKLVKNNWRPVPLSEGVCDAGEVTMSDGTTFEVERSIRGTPIDLGVQSVKEGGQSLVFAETRTRSKSLQQKLQILYLKF